MHNPRVRDPLSAFSETSRFQLRRKLGQGGMGVVFEAFDRERQMVVALKMLSRVSPAGIYRLKREFRSIAALRHENLVTLHDLAHVDGRWLYTMDLVEGVDLMKFVRPDTGATQRTATVTVSPGLAWLDEDGDSRPEREPSATFDEPRLRSALLQLAQCLRAVHDAGHIHRDLKPSNILVRESGQLVLLDFGLVTHLERDDASAESAIVGTPAYMAPEQASGDPPSPAVDWYAVGVMLYEALTGVRPFGGSMVQLLTSKQSTEPPPPTSLVRGLPDDLTGLAVALLRRDPRARPSGDEVLRRLAQREPDPEEEMPSSRRRALVGREGELDKLLDAFRRADVAHVIEVRSPAGMGRTALLRNFVAALPTGAVVLAGRCQEQEAVPYKAFDAIVDALARHLRHLDDDVVQGMLPLGIGALARVFPVLDRVPAIARNDRGLPDTPDVHAFRRRAFAALQALLESLTRVARVVIVIDDLHWGDRDSAALLEALLSPPSPPLLLVASYRATETESPLLRSITDPAFRRRLDAHWSALELSPLAPADSRALAASLLPHPSAELTTHLARESKGVPLHVMELARNLLDGKAPTASLDELLYDRVLAQPASARALLEVLALAAAPLKLSVATRAAADGEGREPDGRVVAELSGRHLVRSSWFLAEPCLDVFSDHVRRAVLRTLSPERQPRTHERLANALEAADAPVELVAHHRDHAGERRRAALLMARAGEQAIASFAFHRAARLLQRAHTLLEADAPERAALIERLGDALAACGHSADAGRRYLLASRLPQPHRAPLDLRRLAAEHLMRSGHIDEGLEVVRGVLAEVGLSLPSSPRRALLDVVVQRARLRLRGLEPSTLTTLSPDDRRRMDACWSVAVGLSLADTIVGADFHARHLLLALDSGDPARVARALALEAAHVGSTGLDRQTRAAVLLDQVDALAHQQRDPRTYGLAKVMRGGTALFAGRWRDAARLTDEAATLFREHCIDVEWELASARRFNHVALYYLGEVAELRRRVPDAIADARSRGDRFAESCAASGSSIVVWLADGQTELARSFLLEEPKRWGATRFALQHLLALQGLTLLDLHAGRGQAARERLAETWPRMKASMILRVQFLKHTMIALRARATLAAASSPADLALVERDAKRLAREGLTSSSGMALLLRAGIERRQDPEAAAALYRSAATELERAEMALHRAAALVRLGELLGGAEGAELCVAARRSLAAQRIQQPDRFVAMLAP